MKLFKRSTRKETNLSCSCWALSPPIPLKSMLAWDTFFCSNHAPASHPTLNAGGGGCKRELKLISLGVVGSHRVPIFQTRKSQSVAEVCGNTCVQNESVEATQTRPTAHAHNIPRKASKPTHRRLRRKVVEHRLGDPPLEDPPQRQLLAKIAPPYPFCKM